MNEPRFTCMSCGRDKPKSVKITRPKGKPSMCQACADLAKARKARTS